MEGLKLIPYVVLVIAISGVIVGAASITLGTFGSSVTTCYNASYEYSATDKACVNATPTVANADQSQGRNFSNEYFAIYQAAQAEGDVAEQLPTVAIIGIMVIIISLIAGVFVYMRYFR